MYRILILEITYVDLCAYSAAVWYLAFSTWQRCYPPLSHKLRKDCETTEAGKPKKEVLARKKE